MVFDPTKLESYPAGPGVYLMRDRKGTILYIGKAKELKKRLRSYFTGADERPMIPHLIHDLTSIETVVVSSEKEALLLEQTLIQQHKPKFNAQLKDDKSHISLAINHRHPWPMVRLVRLKGAPPKDALYFGPYLSAHAARALFDLLTRLFPLRQCSDEELVRRTRPCLLYGMKRCIAPCVKLCTKEEYETFVEGAIRFLKGEDRELAKRLKKEMEEAAEKLEFEKAAHLQKSLQQLEEVTRGTQLVVLPQAQDCDVLSLYREGNLLLVMQLLFRDGKLVGAERYPFVDVLEDDEEILATFLLQHYPRVQAPPPQVLLPFELPDHAVLEELLMERCGKKIELTLPQRGEKKQLVELAFQNAKSALQEMQGEKERQERMLIDVQERLELTRFPTRIECFDTSHLSGTHAVAAMVTFTDGKRDRARTRTFHIRQAARGDDYAALHEVLSRRLARAKEEDDLPDLIIVDGGKGHLNVLLEVFRELEIASCDAAALAKEEGRHDRGMTREKAFLPHRDEPLLLPATSSALHLLQHIRDTAHTAAIQFHKKLRKKSYTTSALEEIPGIGKARRTLLIRHFGSMKRALEASPKELEKVIGKKAAKALKEKKQKN